MTRLHAGFTPIPELPTYVPAPGRRDRVSLVWWQGGPDDDAPLFLIDEAGAASTIVAVWPVDDHGELVVDRLELVEVKVWRLSQALHAELGRLNEDWPLGRHDLDVEDLRVVPHLGSAWRSVLVARDRDALAGRLAALVEGRVSGLVGRLLQG